MNLRNIVLMLVLAGSAAAVHADYTFGDISYNQLDWSNATLDKTQHAPFGDKHNFPYLELEGGAGRSWGNVYGFFDLENWNRNEQISPSTDRRYTTKIVARFNLAQIGAYPVKLYTHVYDTRGSGQQFFSQDRVLGLGTDLCFGNFWIQPFIGGHQVMQQGVGAHGNGWMAGYVAGYDFNAFDQSFSASQWHETEFARTDYFNNLAEPNGTVRRNVGQNGAIALWWNANKHLTTGVQYRYAVNKLGVAGNEYALIYSVKYNF